MIKFDLMLVRANPEMAEWELETMWPMILCVLRVDNGAIPALQKVFQVEGHLREQKADVILLYE